MKTRSFAIYTIIFVLLLLLSINGIRWIPYWEFRGLDFLNLFSFHAQCPGWPIPYGDFGAKCGDPLGRDLLYPPLIYWVMVWTRAFTFAQAELLWAVAIPTLTILGMEIVARADRKRLGARDLIAALLILQMPMVYAIERGNNDALVIPVYAAAIAFFSNRKLFLSGFLIAVAAWMKVYPVVPAFVLLAALASDRKQFRIDGIPFFKGFFAGGIVLGLVFLPDSYRYVTEVLPGLTAQAGGFGTSSHTLYRGLPSLFLKLPLLALWVVLTRKFLAKDPVFILSAGLAISTFFQNLSNDYNLITAYPFLLLVLRRLLRKEMSALDFGVLVWTFWAFVGDRTPLEVFLPNRSALFLQVVWFAGFPFYLMKRIDKGNWPEGNLSPQ